MRRCDVRCPLDAVAYMTDCTLATVERMSHSKRRPKREWQRQIDLAQHGILWMEEYGATVSEHDRAYEVRNAGSVRQWAEGLIANARLSGAGTASA